MESYKKMWKNYFKFEGRTSRKDYWMAVLINFVVSLLISAISYFIGVSVISTIYAILIIIPGLSMGFRRMHDINKSGGWVFISLVPIVGFIIELVLLCQPSVDEDNKYGALEE